MRPALMASSWSAAHSNMTVIFAAGEYKPAADKWGGFLLSNGFGAEKIMLWYADVFSFIT